eukprot:2894575-Amphidinium_carterae.1
MKACTHAIAQGGSMVAARQRTGAKSSKRSHWTRSSPCFAGISRTELYFASCCGRHRREHDVVEVQLEESTPCQD